MARETFRLNECDSTNPMQNNKKTKIHVEFRMDTAFWKCFTESNFLSMYSIVWFKMVDKRRVSPLRSVISFPSPVTLTDCVFQVENNAPMMSVELDDNQLKECSLNRCQTENEIEPRFEDKLFSFVAYCSWSFTSVRKQYGWCVCFNLVQWAPIVERLKKMNKS